MYSNENYLLELLKEAGAIDDATLDSVRMQISPLDSVIDYLVKNNYLTSDYWMYNPEEDLWYGDSDDDYTPLTNVHYGTGGSSRKEAVSFSTGTRGFVLTGSSGTSYFDDVYELLPYELEDD